MGVGDRGKPPYGGNRPQRGL